jgi:hypothetical protein
VTVKLDFEWRGDHGTVDVECRTNDDPVALGCFPGAEGLPACTATVSFPRLGYRGRMLARRGTVLGRRFSGRTRTCSGYRSMLGWVQLVRSTDNESGGDAFENDPFALFGDAPSPYCWYGTEPTLFDAPARAIRDDLDWIAHSFLATTPLDEVMAWQPRRVVALTGFSWGFTIRDGTVAIHRVEPLPRAVWNSHTPSLRAQFPLWHFTDAEAAL